VTCHLKFSGTASHNRLPIQGGIAWPVSAHSIKSIDKWPRAINLFWPPRIVLRSSKDSLYPVLWNSFRRNRHGAADHWIGVEGDLDHSFMGCE